MYMYKFEHRLTCVHACEEGKNKGVQKGVCLCVCVCGCTREVGRVWVKRDMLGKWNNHERGSSGMIKQ